MRLQVFYHLFRVGRVPEIEWFSCSFFSQGGWNISPKYLLTL